MIRGRGIFIVSLIYVLTLFALTIYSFSQVDLNLTLSSTKFYQQFQSQLTYLGYFNRPFSTGIYCTIIFLLFACYLYFLKFFSREGNFRRNIFCLSLITAIILLFSYPAFSYDIFNYIFDARIFVFYKSNPNMFRPLDFPADTWIRFLHWTHRPSVYPTSWFVLSAVPYFLGFGKFVLTLFQFKLMAGISYLASVFLIDRILLVISPKRRFFGLAFFAFNPLVIIETLVSGHSEMVMMAIFLLAIYLFVKGKILSSLFVGLISAGVKYVTLVGSFVFILPYLLERFTGVKKSTKFYLLLILFIQIAAVVFMALRTELQPWYLLWFIPIIALLSEFETIFIMGIVFSVAGLLLYIQWLLQGEWDINIATEKYVAIALALIIGLIFSLSIRLKKKIWLN